MIHWGFVTIHYNVTVSHVDNSLRQRVSTDWYMRRVTSVLIRTGRPEFDF